MDFDAIVIGSGFGGAVTACRLSQAKVKVAIVERGRRWDRDFPRNFHSLTKWLWQIDRGLFDVQPLSEVHCVQGAGYGGGSLVYANVQMRPPADVFEQGWPAGYSREELDPHYDLVAYMLQNQTIDQAPGGLPPKTLLQHKAARALGREAQLVHPALAITFSEPGVATVNVFGAEQAGCTQCGECDVGCNVGAKNTLDMNYLRIAEAAGAKVYTDAEVTHIHAIEGGYAVTWKDHSRNGKEVVQTAERVFVCAGAVRSTQLLLRCRADGGLPQVGNMLGWRYHVNADTIAFAFETEEAWSPTQGPVITTALLHNRKSGDLREWFVLEDGGHPRAISALLQWLDTDRDLLAARGSGSKQALHDAVGAGWSQAQNTDPTDHEAVFLMMGRDTTSGRICHVPLAPTGSPFEFEFDWDVQGNLPVTDAETRLATDLAQALGGKMRMNPFWENLHVPVSVHNMGGCAMSERAADGVVDPYGEVWHHKGLYVLDAAILPVSIGTNPAATIAAVAERNIEHHIRAWKDPTWQAPERAKAVPYPEPLDGAVVPPEGTPQTQTPAIGLRFTETMHGFVQPGFQPVDGYVDAEAQAKRAGHAARFKLTITIANLDAFLCDPAHQALATGTVVVDGLTGPDGAPVRNGQFNLFTAHAGYYDRKMLYRLPFAGTDGKAYVFTGLKEVHDDPGFDVWRDTTTLFSQVHGGDVGGPVWGTGILTLRFLEFMRQLGTFEVTGTDDFSEKADAMARFGSAFLGNLWDVYFKSKIAS